jgi:drug/metabolite transporter (DMT)-like permease
MVLEDTRWSEDRNHAREMSGMAPQPAAPAWQVWLALAVVYLVWGSTYLGMRVLVETIPPLLGTGVRFLAAGLILYPVLLARHGWTQVRVRRRQVAASALVGVLFLGGGTGLVTVAERDVPSGLAAVLVATMPLVVVLLRWLAREPVPGTTAVGVLVGFAGVAVLLLPGNSAPEATGLGLTLTLVASVSIGVASFLSPRLPVPGDALVATAIELLIAGVVLTAAGLLLGEAAGLAADQVSGASLVALGYLIVAGSLIAYSAYVWLLANVPVTQAATYTYVNPIVAVVLGWLILHEQVTLATLAGTALIVGSVAVVVGRERSGQADDRAGPWWRLRGRPHGRGTGATAR